MPSFFSMVMPLALAGSVLANPLLRRGDDACLAAVTGKAALGADNLRKEHCSSFIKTIVTPSANTVTITKTDDAPATTDGRNSWKRDVTVCPNEVPNYASACDDNGYKSACSVWGVSGDTTITIPATTTTKTIYIGKGGNGGICASTSVITSTKSACSGGTTTATVTDTKTVGAGATATSTSTTTEFVGPGSVVTSTVISTSMVTVYSGSNSTTTVTVPVAGPSGSNSTITVTATVAGPSGSNSTTTVTATVAGPSGSNSTTTVTATVAGPSGSNSTTTVTATVAGPSGSNSTTTVTSTVTAPSSTGSIPSTAQCIDDAKALEFINAFKDLLEYTSYNGTSGAPGRGYHANVSAQYLAEDFEDYSDSINWMAGIPLGGVTFPSRAVFDSQQGLGQPELTVTTSGYNFGCNHITWRWNALTQSYAHVSGINHFVLTSDLTQIKTNYAEFDNANWIQSFSQQLSTISCVVPGGLTSSQKRSTIRSY